MLISTLKPSRFLVIFPFLFLFNSCNKTHDPEIDPGKQKLQNVTFSFENFKKEIKPFDSPVLNAPPENTHTTNPEKSELIGYFSFDNENLNPDYNKGELVSMNTRPDQSSFLKFVPHVKSLSDKTNKILEVKGVKEVLLYIKTNNLAELDRVEFDFGASQKSIDGFDLAYQYPNNSQAIVETKSFKLKPESIKNKTMETYQLFFQNGREFKTGLIYVMIKFDGEIQNKGNYNKQEDWINWFDNIRIYGKLKNPPKPKIVQLPYFIFNKKNAELVQQGNFIPTEKNKDLLLELPIGSYDYVMIYNEGADELFFPNQVKKKEDFSVTSLFKNRYARSFAVQDSFELKESLERKVNLKRLYSQITIDFNDIRNLSDIKNIKIKPLNEPYFWRPFNPLAVATLSNTISNEIVFEQDFNLHREISFNHFMGFSTEELPISYEIEVNGKEKLIRKFRLNAKIKNNVRLLFKGPIYPSGIANKFFEILIDEKWNETKVIEFL